MWQPRKPTEQTEAAPLGSNRHKWVEWLVFCGLLSAGVGARLLCQDLPNFAPVAALALFAGYYFSSRIFAIMVPILVMLASDLILGTYNPSLMIVVYGMLALPVTFRNVLRRNFNFAAAHPRSAAWSSLGIFGCSLFASIAFFLVTNFAVWWQGTWYTADIGGLVQCYVQALPFFRYTLTGDLLFTIVLFGGYALATASIRDFEPVPTERG